MIVAQQRCSAAPAPLHACAYFLISLCENNFIEIVAKYWYNDVTDHGKLQIGIKDFLTLNYDLVANLLLQLSVKTRRFLCLAVLLRLDFCRISAIG